MQRPGRRQHPLHLITDAVLVHWQGEVRPEPRHLRALAHLEARAFDAPWSRSQLASTLDQGVTTTFALLDNHQSKTSALAYACLQQVLDEAELLRLAVAPELRRRGLGRAVLQAALEHMRTTSPLRACLLEVAADNRPALKLYETFGFRLEGRRRGYYSAAPTHGKNLDANSDDSGATDALLYRFVLEPPRGTRY